MSRSTSPQGVAGTVAGRPLGMLLLIAALLLSGVVTSGVTASRAFAATVDPRAERFDLTGDGVVSHADVMEVVMAWTNAREAGRSCGDDLSRVDIDGDGCVTVADIQAISARVGYVVSPDKDTPFAFSSTVALAAGSTFVVNSTGDQEDAAPGDGVCQTAAGTCTLRAAIVEANRQPGANTIAFAIPGTGPHSINIASELPTLSDTTGPTTIDGYTQPGAMPNTHATASNAVLKIQIVGPRALGNPTSINGIMITSPNNRIQGLSFSRLKRSIWLSGMNANNNVLAGNFVGTNAAGQPWYDQITNVEKLGGDPGAFGIWFSNGASYNRVGGSSPAERNVVSGNANDGIGMRNEGTSHNVIIGNLIGLAPSGTVRLVNWGDGLDFNYGASSNRIGGLGPGERNVISGNRGEGIEISHDPTTALNQVIGNYIGVDITGNFSNDQIRNTGYAISLEDGSANNSIGPGNVMANNGKGGIELYGQFNAGNKIFDNLIGITPNGTRYGNAGPGIRVRYHATRVTIGPGNVITGHQGPGVLIIDSTVRYNTVTRNSIYGNTGLGIDIDPIGVNPNDQYSKNGANDRLNFPVLGTANTTTVTGSACANCIVEVFVADSPAGQYGEGRAFAGSATAAANGAFSVAVSGVVAGNILTATATDSSGNTSEFSQNIVVDGVAPPPPPPAITLPGTFEAEDYREGGPEVGYHDTTAGNSGGAYRFDDVDIQTCTDAASGQTCHNVGWIDAGEWLAYDVAVATTGYYRFTFRVAAPSASQRLHVEIDGTNVTGPISLPSTGGWQVWADVQSGPVQLTAGAHTLKLVAETSGMNWNYVKVEATAAPPPPPPPVIALPGTFEIEDYRAGGPGVGYHDTTPGNTGGAYRQDDVDIQTCSDAASGNPCYNVGWTDPGEWLAYDVSFASSGLYTFTMRIATPSNNRVFRVELNGVDVTGPVAVPNTGGYQVWTDVTSVPVQVAAGSYTLRVVTQNAGMNLNFMTVAASDAPPPPPPPPVIALPGTFEIEDYRPGGQGVGYSDTTPGNTGGAYRQDDVDIQGCTDAASASPCYNVGWTEAGEWLAYDVSFASSGTYRFTARVATPGDNRRIRVELNGVNVTGSVFLPNTGGYQNWASVTSGAVQVAAGTYTLRIVTENGGMNLNFMTVTKE